MFSALTKQLIDALRNMPGIGPKSAQRLAFYLLSPANQHKGLSLAEALQKALSSVGQCARCRIYTEHSQCELCQNSQRNHSLLCVVESPADVVAIEQTNNYRGLYYVLHGHLSPLDGIGPQEIGIHHLIARLQTESIHELILATNPTMEGKATAHYIANHIDHNKMLCSRIAYGVPIGGELEYLDGGTLSHAFNSRTPINDVIN